MLHRVTGGWWWWWSCGEGGRKRQDGGRAMAGAVERAGTAGVYQSWALKVQHERAEEPPDERGTPPLEKRGCCRRREGDVKAAGC